jgi:hypothetical protein
VNPFSSHRNIDHVEIVGQRPGVFFRADLGLRGGSLTGHNLLDAIRKSVVFRLAVIR